MALPSTRHRSRARRTSFPTAAARRRAPSSTSLLAITETLAYRIGTQNPTTVTIDVAATAPPPASSTTNAGTRPETSGFSNRTFGDAFTVLFLLFVLAVVLESALAILFNWRPFVERLNARAVRPLVSFAVALLLVFTFDIDLVTAMVNVIRLSAESPSPWGRILTAMVIAGGSAGVNNLMVGLGFRQVRTPETAVPKPPAKHGWISVSVVRKEAVGPVSVSIGVPTAGKTPFVHVIRESTRPGWRYFLRDPGRFPGSGGYTVAAGSDVTVEVKADTNNPAAPLVKTWGPNLIGEGAIIDLTFEM
jgi:hypothetical protein